MVLFLFFTSTIVFNLKPSSHHLPRLALLFAGGVILVYLMNEIKMLLLLLLSGKQTFCDMLGYKYHSTVIVVILVSLACKRCRLAKHLLKTISNQ